MVMFKGGCDVSAAVTIPDTTLFVGASDENNELRVYDWKQGGLPVATTSLDAFFGTSKEADLEGAAWLGDRIFWIASHGRNKEGKEKPERRQLFATKVTVSGSTVSIEPEGVSCGRLLADINATPALASLGLDKASMLAPKAEGGLSIEGLAPGPNDSLLIGFRNPILDKRHALVLPLLNPKAVVKSKDTACEFGTPVRLDLGGLGIRAMEFVARTKSCLLIAGRFGDGTDFKLFQWTGRAADPPIEVATALPADFRPEELIVTTGAAGDMLMLLSDDGERKVDGTNTCKDLKDTPEKQSFQSHTMPLPAAVGS